MKSFKTLAVAAASVALLSSGVQADNYVFNFLGLAGDGGEVVPPTGSNANMVESGSGPGGNSFSFVGDNTGGTLTIQGVAFQALELPSFAVWLMNGPIGAAGTGVRDLSSTSDLGVSAGTINAISQNYVLTGPEATDLLASNFYLEIRTQNNFSTFANNPGFPIIRGQLLAVVPEPSTYAAVGFLGLAGAWSLRRRFSK